MRKTPLLLTVLMLFLSMTKTSYAQTKTPAQPKTSAPVVNAKDTMLCAEWKLLGIEEFGVMQPPTAKQTNDKASFNLNHEAKIMHEGVEKNGTWDADRAKTNVTITVAGTNEKRLYKIIRLSPDTLMLEFKDAALVKTRYEYIRTK